MMPVRFNEYLKEPKSMDLETALRLHGEMLEEIGTDPDSVELYEELCRAAARYANFRAWWLLWDKEKKAEQDEGRTASHNALIVKFNQLARYLKMQGKTAAWRDELGHEEEDLYFRKRIGDFGCFLAFVNGVHAR